MIPHGYVATYLLLARIYGIHPRAVAAILRTNESTEVYPCYRVVHADGRVGGYRLGPTEKIRRLREHGVIVEKGRVAKKYLW